MRIDPDSENAMAEELERLRRYDAAADERARRLSRYDEAVRLLRVAKFDDAHWHEADAFLASEPKGEEGGR